MDKELWSQMEEVRKGEKPMTPDLQKKIIEANPNSKIRIKVISQKGFCMAGHKVGDEWVMRGNEDSWKTPGGICMFAFDVLYPYINMLMYGGSFPWQLDPDVWPTPCPDSLNPVVFELRCMDED